jgi:hypothetical protein
MLGVGTLSTPCWQYFNQGLFIFDFIIVAPGDRFTGQDVEILANCERCSVPSFVRSKADMHIDNIIKETRDAGKDSCEARRRRIELVRRKYTDDTRQTIKSELGKAGLDSEKKI